MDTPILQGLLRTIELKDRSTAAHTWRVTLYAKALAEHAGRPRDVIERITHAAALHLGKIDIPDHILIKPGRLDDEEYAVMQAHTTLGYDRLVSMGVDDPITLNLVRYHHERWDGLGYPDKLKGEQIPVAARYFAVIDSFDAMTSVRPYRQDIGEEAAHHAIDELNWILHYFNDENPVPVFEGMASANAARKSAL
jgi:HD-GYP domain-containing protein (c-di-GMP phosphodiesterase class II)